MNKITPGNLQQCFECLDILLSNEDKEFFKQNTENEVITRTHHTLGRKIRNDWGLWDSNSILYKHIKNMGLEHPDDMSGLIIKSYYRIKNNLPLNIEINIKKCQKYWDENNHGFNKN